MKKTLSILLILCSLGFLFTACFDWFVPEDEEVYDYNIPTWLQGNWADSSNTISYQCLEHNIITMHGTGYVDFRVDYNGSAVNEALIGKSYSVRLTLEGTEFGFWRFTNIDINNTLDSLTYTFSGLGDTEGPMTLTKR